MALGAGKGKDSEKGPAVGKEPGRSLGRTVETQTQTWSWWDEGDFPRGTERTV